MMHWQRHKVGAAQDPTVRALGKYPKSGMSVSQKTQAIVRPPTDHGRRTTDPYLTPPIKFFTGLISANAMTDAPRQTAAMVPNNSGRGAEEMKPAA